MTSSYAWWERHGPRLPSHGIKAQSRRGAFAKSWWASRWIAALERLNITPGRLARGRTYARVGQVMSLNIGRGEVNALVQGSEPEPYHVRIQFRQLSNDEWDRVIDAMASEALYAARLLSGEMPEQIEEVFSDAGTSLFPKDVADMRTNCTCKDVANPCKHIAAVHYLIGERFDEDPFLMFVLRGRSQDEIIAALRARRVGPESEPTVEVEQPAEAEPDLEGFWSVPPRSDEVALHFALPESDALAIKRLGPPPFARDQDDLLNVMERLYEQIGQYALLLAMGDLDSGGLRAMPQYEPTGDEQTIAPE